MLVLARKQAFSITLLPYVCVENLIWLAGHVHRIPARAKRVDPSITQGQKTIRSAKDNPGYCTLFKILINISSTI